MFVTTLVLLFLVKLRFPRGQPITDVIQRRYDQPTLRCYRIIEKTAFRIKKIEHDLEFLRTCKDYGRIPKFIKFKVYDSKFHHTPTYKSWLFHLLDIEIRKQRNKLSKLNKELIDHKNTLQTLVKLIDFKCLNAIIDNYVNTRIKKVAVTHSRKLKSLGIDINRHVNVDKVIFNLSSRSLSKKEKDALSLGLEFALPPTHVNYVKFFLPFEKLCFNLKNFSIYKQSWTHVWHNISALARNSFKQYCKVVNDTKDDNDIFTVLQQLKDDKDIVITRPDKGRGVVILDKVDYDRKLTQIVSDPSKFKVINSDMPTTILKYEDKLNRMLRSVKQDIGDVNFNFMYASGSRPGHLYGLPKVHKPHTPLRPILSAIGTFNYNVAKFLVPLIAPLTTNEFTV